MSTLYAATYRCKVEQDELLGKTQGSDAKRCAVTNRCSQGKYQLDYLSNVPPPITENHDMIGPPNPVSNLRPMILRVAPDESPLEKEYRLAREETAKWNELFWSKHNTSFFKERKAFMEARSPADMSPSGTTTVSADEMSVFYKAFLDKNWKIHLDYNIEWYRRNIGLVFLAFWVNMSRAKQQLFS
uniref:Apoptogenic protein 1, mitochondrial n=1 Tax=Timema shepardi TaxID=629360 RepID=A0A7R9B7J9_TIMSH|nr:unnamed protein product [Timema shepardi]